MVTDFFVLTCCCTGRGTLAVKRGGGALSGGVSLRPTGVNYLRLLINQFELE